jgi:hypothetical protein
MNLKWFRIIRTWVEIVIWGCDEHVMNCLPHLGALSRIEDERVQVVTILTGISSYSFAKINASPRSPGIWNGTKPE